MLPIKSWRIIYADGSEFTSNDGTWAEAPPFGVQAVVYYHVDDRYKTVDVIANDESVYYYEADIGVGPYKLGLWMDTDGYYRILDYAHKSDSP